VQGQKLPAGQAVAVNSTSVDSDGVHASTVVDARGPGGLQPRAQLAYIVSQTCRAARRTHVIQVKAFDARGRRPVQSVTITLEAPHGPAESTGCRASPRRAGRNSPT